MGAAVTQQTAKGAQLAKPALLPVYLCQCFVLLLLALILGLVINTVAAYSAVIGGFISIGPNSYFARWAFRFSGAQAASSVARSFYIGEAGKFIFTALLFAMAFLLIEPINVVVIFLSYIFITVLNGFLALRLLKR
jgi:ATP synthase protein I